MIKVSSITFIKEGSIPAPTRNGPNSAMLAELADAMAKAQKGQGVQFQIAGYKKHQRYVIQKGLQKRGLKIQVLEIDAKKGILAVRRAEE